ncbi:MAG: hypothetical protein RR346_12230, partial [Bacteroidales bacterium]
YTDEAKNATMPQEGDVAEGTAFFIVNNNDTTFYLRKTLAAKATNLNIAKSANAINLLKYNEVPYATTKIANPDGIQFFTGLTDLTASSNQFTSADYATNEYPVVTIDFSGMSQLRNLTINACSITVLDLSTNQLVEKISCTGTSQGSKEKNTLRIAKIKGANLISLDLSKNNLTRTNLEGLMTLQSPPLTSINLSSNKESDFEIPYQVFNSTTLTTKKGVVAGAQ